MADNKERRAVSTVGRYTRWVIIGFIIVQYYQQFQESWWSGKNLLTAVLFVCLLFMQFWFVHGASIRRVAAEMLMEGAIATTLYVMHGAEFPLMVLIFLPLIFRCGRSLPLHYGLIGVAVITVVPELALKIAGFTPSYPFLLKDPSLLLIFIPGWMLRRQDVEFRRTRQLLEQIRQQQGDLEESHHELVKHALEAEENAILRERGRMASEIHDTVGHALTSMIRGLDACRELIRSNPSEAENYVVAMRSVAKEGLEDVRRSVRSMQETTQLFAGSEWEVMLHRFAENVRATTGTNIVFVHSMEVPSPKRYAVYQCLKEAVTNAIRHGRATAITVMQRTHDRDVRIEIASNGTTPKEPIVPGIGLSGIVHRMQSVGADAQFGVVDGEFRVTLSWTVDAEDTRLG